MDELKLGSMEKIARKKQAGSRLVGNFARRAIESVADDGMPQRRQVNANLVGTASVDFYFEESEFAVFGLQPSLNLVVCDSFAASGAAGSHADASNSVATNGGGDGAGVAFKMTVDERDVSLFDAAGGELRGQLPMSGIVLRHHDESAGSFVEAMDDAWSQLAANLRQRPEAMQQSVDQGAVVAVIISGSGAGVHHHPSGLVDDGEVGVFIDHIERNFFGDSADRWPFDLAENLDSFPAAEMERGLRGLAVNEDFFLRDELLDAGAAGFR